MCLLFDDLPFLQMHWTALWDQIAYNQNFLEWVLEQQHDCSEDELSEPNTIDDVDRYFGATDILISPIPTYR